MQAIVVTSKNISSFQILLTIDQIPSDMSHDYGSWFSEFYSRWNTGGDGITRVVDKLIKVNYHVAGATIVKSLR